MKMTFSSAEFLLNQYGLTKSHLDAINTYGSSLKDSMEKIVDEFYDWLLLTPDFSDFFSNSQILFHVKQQQAKYWREFITADIDEDYIKRRRDVGITHARIGLPVQPYLSSMSFFLRKLSTPILNKTKLSKSDLFTLQAITSLAQLDVAVAIDAIFHQHAESFDRMAQGDFKYDNAPRSENDLFGIALKNMTSTLNNIESVCEKVADGQLEVSVAIKSDNDRLAKAINGMIKKLNDVSTLAHTVAQGNYELSITPSGTDDVLGNALNVMTQSLKELTREKETELNKAKALGKLSDTLRDITDTYEFYRQVLSFTCQQFNAVVGRLYINIGEQLIYQSGYADSPENQHKSFKLGEGLPGQAALSGKIIELNQVPSGYIKVSSGLGENTACSLLVWPVMQDKKVLFVIELGTLASSTAIDTDFMQQCEDKICSYYSIVKAGEKINSLLTDSIEKARMLGDSNSALEEQTHALLKSEEALMLQQNELEVSNQALINRTHDLEQQKQVLLDTQSELEEKSLQLEMASQYKSEFLANMSHELRTPLNSLLLLANILSENAEANLTEEQLESTRVIYHSGQELLELINDILDLSKVEAGKMETYVDNINIRELVNSALQRFTPQAKVKNISLHLSTTPDAPKIIKSDSKKLQHILRNLISNAIKFTSSGEVKITLRALNNQQDKVYLKDVGADGLAITISDTGVGIAEDKQEMIFEAFKQADGTISRQYGGTGLGLSIVKQYTLLLKGGIHLTSTLGKGSEFTLYLPKALNPNFESVSNETFLAPALNRKTINSAMNSSEEKSLEIGSKLSEINENDQILLVIEDDERFAKVICDLAISKGLKSVISKNGAEGYALAEKIVPAAIILDVMLPSMDGWSIFDRIKDNPALRHIPIQFISAHHDLYNSLQKGAIGYLTKPVNKEDLLKVFNRFSYFSDHNLSHILLVSQQIQAIDAIKNCIQTSNMTISICTINDVIASIPNKKFDCIIIDVEKNKENVFSILDELSKILNGSMPPLIMYSSDTMDREFSKKLLDYNHMAIKETSNFETLLDDVTLFLHAFTEKLRPDQKKILYKLHDNKGLFQDKKILIVDDDMRNVYALSKLLRSNGMLIVVAEDGRNAIEMLQHNPDVDLILMDIMMPIMDGYEAIRQIRSNKSLSTIPIVALTAKTLPEDRHKSLLAGANDYLAKPIDPNRLLMTMRVWLQQESVKA